MSGPGQQLLNPGEEQLNPALKASFMRLVERTVDPGVKDTLLFNMVELVTNEVTSEMALQGLTLEELLESGLSKAAAKALKVAFPTPSTAGAEGAAHAAGSGAALPLMRDELARRIVDMTFHPLASPSTHRVEIMGLTLKEWPLTSKEVIDFAQAALGNATLTSAIQCDTPGGPADSEATTNAWFWADAMTRINIINRARDVQHEWILQPASTFDDNTVADFMYKDMITGKFLVPAEGKYDSVVPFGDLMTMYNHRKSGIRQRLFYVLSQVARYVINAGALHGVITTLRHTFLLRRLHVDSLEFAVTRGYLNTQTNPSVPQVLFYVGEQEAQIRVALQASMAPERLFIPTPGHGAGGSSSGADWPITHSRASAQQHGDRAATGNGRQVTDARPADYLCSGLQLLSRLAVGQCGNVFLGSLNGEQVAVKSGDAANTPCVVERLRREAAAYKGPLAPLCGHYIPHLLYEGFTPDNLVYTVITSFIDGKYPQPCLPDAVLHSAAEALSAVHSAGLAHGDLFYNNIIVQGDKAYLIDFGECYPNPRDDQRHEEMATLYGIFGRKYRTSSSGQSTGSADVSL